MGYTHYWTFKKPAKGKAKETEELYQKAIHEIARMVKNYNGSMTELGLEGNRLSGYTAHTPVGSYGGINFNGKGDLSHENFVLREHYSQNFEGQYSPGFNFCKTVRKPYDLVVVAALAILKYRLKDLVEVSSDGQTDDLIDGTRFAGQVLRRKIKIPVSRDATI